jgi:hypothetical protein
MSEADMAKKKPANDMVQMGVWLPRKLYDDLKAIGGKRGSAKELRRRLEASFAQDVAADPKTVELLDAIKYLARTTTDCYGHWSQDRFAFEVLQEAITVVLTQRFQPAAKAEAKPTDLADLLFGYGGGKYLKDKEAMGRMIAAIWLSSNPKREA